MNMVEKVSLVIFIICAIVIFGGNSAYAESIPRVSVVMAIAIFCFYAGGIFDKK